MPAPGRAGVARLRTLYLGALLAVAVLLPAGSAAAESQTFVTGTFVTRFPFTTALANPCVTPEDLVLINGEVLVETHLTFNDNHIL